MGNAAQLAQSGMQQVGMPSQQAMYDAQSAVPGTSGARSKKDSVSFAPQMGMGEAPTPLGIQPTQPSAAGPSGKVPGQAPKPSSSGSAQKSSSGAAGAKRQPGPLKKADSTVGQKVPQKKASVAGGPPGRKASTAIPAGKGGGAGPRAGGGGQDDGGIGKVWKKIVE